MREGLGSKKGTEMSNKGKSAYAHGRLIKLKQKPKKRNSAKPTSKHESLYIGDNHHWMEVQIQNQSRLVLAVHNKHLLDSDYDSATILLGVNEIKLLRNKCNAALDSCEAT